MSNPALDISSLTPLPYHQLVVNYLKTSEPAVWSWASSLGVQQEHAQEVRAQLLRDTYRLRPDTHPDAYQACETALQRLHIQAPATLYQAGDGGMNASLYYLAGEVHVVFYGPILERLDAQELLALRFGHPGEQEPSGGGSVQWTLEPAFVVRRERMAPLNKVHHHALLAHK